MIEQEPDPEPTVTTGLPPWEDDRDDPLVCDERILADFRFETGTRVTFTHDRRSGEFGVHHESNLEESAPLMLGDMDSILALYIAITPEATPVPDLLREEPQEGLDLTASLVRRDFTGDMIVEQELDWVVPRASAQSVYTCGYFQLSWEHWQEVGNLTPATFYASNFGGKRRYSESLIGNCLPVGYPDYLWVRHRIYYKEGDNYLKHYDRKVAPGRVDHEIKGSIKRYRRIAYDSSWGGHGNPTVYRYRRAGRFMN